MNWFLIGIIIFVIVYLALNAFAKASSKKIALFLKRLAVMISVVLAAVLAIGGKFIFSLPFLLILLSGLKIKGLTALQMFQLWRLIQFMRNSKNRSTASTQGSTNISIEEAYKLLGLKKVAAKRKSFKPHKNFKKKSTQT